MQIKAVFSPMLTGFICLTALGYGYSTSAPRVVAEGASPQLIAQISPNQIAVRNLEGFEGVVKALALSPDGKILLVGTGDSAVTAFDLEKNETIYSKSNTVNFYSSIAVSSDGTIFAMGDEDNVAIFNFADGSRLKTLSGHTKRISDVAIDPDTKTLVSVSGGDRTIRVWDIESGQLVKTLADNVGPTTTVTFTPDGKMFITGAVGDDRTVKFWDATTLELLQSSTQQTGFINALSVTPDGRALVAAVRNFVKAWDLASYKELFNKKGPSLEINTIAVSPDSRLIATANKEGTIMLFDAKTGRKLTTLSGHKGWVLSLAFSPDGKYLYSGAEDKIVKIWQLTP
jgi:WD40 repeat protein